MNQQSPYQLLGDDKIRELASAFYDAMDELTEAEDIRRMHSDNLDEIKEKLYEYLCGWMGGPPKYMEKYGTICLTDPHKPYAIGAEHRDQWLLCMDRALEKIEAPEQVKTMLKDPMYDLADFIRNT